MPETNIRALQLHLAEISRAFASGAHAAVLMDRTGWHTTGRLKMPDCITIILLPSGSPGLNPVECIWQYLRQNRLTNCVLEAYGAMLDAGCWMRGLE